MERECQGNVFESNFVEISPEEPTIKVLDATIILIVGVIVTCLAIVVQRVLELKRLRVNSNNNRRID